MCLGDWKSHGSEYYECSRYKENPNIANESVHAQVNYKNISLQQLNICFVLSGPRSSQKVSSLLRTMGESLEIASTGAANFGPS